MLNMTGTQMQVAAGDDDICLKQLHPPLDVQLTLLLCFFCCAVPREPDLLLQVQHAGDLQ
jgi:hypothetical protein